MKPRYKRRKKLIKPRLQLRLTAVFAGISVLSCLLLSLGLVEILLRMANTMPSGGEYLTNVVPSIFQKAVFYSLVIVLPVTVMLGVLTTFRVAGPVYRFEQYLAQVAAGEADGPCRIRKSDHLQDLCRAINTATAPLRVTCEGERGVEEKPASAGTRAAG